MWAASPAAEAPEVRDYAAFRVCNTVDIGHTLDVQGAIDEMDTLRWYAQALNAACEHDIQAAAKKGRPTLKHCLEAKPFEPPAEILLPTRDAMLGFISSGLLTHPEMVGLNPEYLHELMWGAAPRAALARALLAGKLFHFDINDGYRLKHDVDIGVALVNPLDWLNVLVLLRSHGYHGPFNLDYKRPRVFDRVNAARSLTVKPPQKCARSSPKCSNCSSRPLPGRISCRSSTHVCACGTKTALSPASRAGLMSDFGLLPIIQVLDGSMPRSTTRFP